MTSRVRASAGPTALALAIFILVPRLAWPHAELLRSQPAAGAVIESEPREIHIWFSEAVEAPSSSAIRVLDPDGNTLATEATVEHDDPTEMTTSVAVRAVGTYTVRWRAISADGHPIDGTFTFSVGRATAAPVSTESATPSSYLGLQAAGRWLHLLALSLVVGPLGLIVLGVPREVHHRLWRLSTVGAASLIPAALVMLVAQSAAVAGTLGAGLHYDPLQQLLVTRWGLIWATRTLVATALTVVLAGRVMSRRWTLVTTAPLAAALIVTTSLNGHPGATPPVWLSVAVDWAHTAASAMWIGGLFALVAVVLPWAIGLPPALRRVKLAVIVPQFSTVALVCVQLLFLTGMYHVWAHVSRPEELTTTPYGRALLVKLGLVALTLLGGAVNLTILKPRLASPTTGHGNTAARLFRHVVSAEAVLVVAVLGAVGVLTSLPPASASGRAVPAVLTAAAPEATSSPALSLVGRAGDSTVTLSLASAEPGSNRATIALQGPEETQPSQVRLRILPPATSGISTSTVTPDRVGSTFRATLALAPAGTWGISVVVTSGGAAEEVATFHVTLPLKGAGEILALADGRMNALRSVTEDVETLADSERSHHRYIYQAPDRRLREGEVLEITAGDRLYMRHGSTWHVQSADRFTWPSFRFAESAREVAVAGHETVDGRDCVVVSFVDGTDNSRTSLWIAADSLRVVQQVTATKDGYVVRKFSNFDAGARIKTPDVQASGSATP